MKRLLTSSVVFIRGAMAAALASDPAAADQAPVERQRSATIAREPSHRELRRTTLKSDDEIDTVPVEILWSDIAMIAALGLFTFGIMALSNVAAAIIMAERLQP